MKKISLDIPPPNQMTPENPKKTILHIMACHLAKPRISQPFNFLYYFHILQAINQVSI